MGISDEIEAVYRRALLLRERATAHPVDPALLNEALGELYLVLEELQTIEAERLGQYKALIESQHQLVRERQRYQDLFDLAPDGYLVTDRQGIIQEANVAIAALLGEAPASLMGKPMALFLTEHHRNTFYTLLNSLSHRRDTPPQRNQTWETQIHGRDGSTIDVLITLASRHPLQGNQSPLRWLIRDITAQKQAQETMRRQALYDPLTALPNRTLFETYLPKAISRAQRQGEPMAVLFLDLDHFKIINDTLGHPIGDRVLQQVAQRLSQHLRQADLLVRWGGDEFTLLLTSPCTPEAVSHTCDRIIENLRPSFAIDTHALHLSISIGVALYPQHGQDPATLLSRADHALYQAKQEGRSTYRFYQAGATVHTTETLQLEDELHHALEKQELRLYFQPQLHYPSGTITGVEALLRWQHPRLGLLTPAAFLPLASKSDQMVALGNWVLQTGIQQMQQWQARGIAIPLLAVNLSAVQLQSPHLVEYIKHCLTACDYNPAQLLVEITETTAVKRIPHSQMVLNQLISLGVKVGLDDFGTGYSSLALLKQLPLHQLKIDRSFVADLDASLPDRAIAQAIVALAHGLGLEAIAEGVETEAQARILVELGCEQMQGHWFSPPVPAAAIADIVTQGAWHCPLQP